MKHLFILASVLLSSCVSADKSFKPIGEFESVKVYKAEDCTVFSIKNTNSETNYFFSCPRSN